MADSVGEAFPKGQARVRALIGEYQRLPKNAGAFGAVMLEQVLQRADQAAISGDVVAILRSFQELKGCE